MSQKYWKYVDYLKDYCSNCTLAGFSYIANQNLHLIERVFWLICVVLSAMGSYILISQYQRDFNSRAVSIVYESLPSTHKVPFPTIAVCDMYNKFIASDDLIDFVTAMDPRGEKYYNYDVETFINFLVYPYFYREDNIKGWCTIDCEGECARCPDKNLRQLYKRFMTNCTEFFQYCEFALKPIDCCTYFRPMTTPLGNCFMFNSILNNEKGSPTWYNSEVNPMTEIAKLKIITTKATQLSVLNEEDIPHNSLPGYKVEAAKTGLEKTFQIFMQTMSNDPDVRDIAPEFRQCRFPDELLADTAYKAYSFSTCFMDCLRTYQMLECNCTVYSYMPEQNPQNPDCDLKGFLCLEKFNLVRPDARNLLPWADSKYTCDCLPSCTESDYKVVYDHQFMNKSNRFMTISVTMPEFATERYRRQALRTRLDVVVTIGGILGLFLGASILSGIEFVYYFTLRLFNNYRMERNQQQKMRRQQR